MLDLSRQYAGLRDEILAAVTRACDSQKYILGDEVTAFEREFATLCGSALAVGCASGTDALWLALVAAGVREGDSVITTPLSFFATASSILRAGARPVFVDIDPETLNIDPAKLEQSLRHSPQRKAVMPVHLYGQCADADAINCIAAEFKLSVVEDAAQAAGATWNGRLAGSLGHAAAFSFYPTKNLSAFGDAGALTTDDAALAEHARSLRNHGAKQRYYHDEIGANSRLDSIQAAVLRVKMPHLKRWNEERRQRAKTYDRLFASAGLTRTSASSLPPVTLLKTRPQAYHIYHQYVIRVRERDKLREFLKERGVGSEVYYPVPLHQQKCFAYLGYAPGDLPEAERAALDVLALPMFAELQEDEQRHVVDSIAEFYS
ncbi:MAG TPA: DegT/DnrJ/EryC1/StrS family aminotransferase [Candidatus Limnocylindrales bacterium]|jgi:dTDP-4-amino-4,6-dideoxygalactose transaminase|nr:DegT/DnrJ/EryC1/StrS family aminotransferase [Candidatus Limnocylindrales bacterium]